MDHVDLTALRQLADPMTQFPPWYVSVWATVRSWFSEETAEPSESAARKKVKLGLEIEDQALKAARRWVDRDQEELVELFRHTARLLGLEHRIVVRPAPKPERPDSRRR
jgi:hypothetical protein